MDQFHAYILQLMFFVFDWAREHKYDKEKITLIK